MREAIRSYGDEGSDFARREHDLYPADSRLDDQLTYMKGSDDLC
jgi:hypothetical protein